MKSTVFLITGQNFDYNIKIQSGKTTLKEVLDYFLSKDLIHEHGIELYQSDTGHLSPGWGRIVYKVEDGVLRYYNSNVDSSG